MDLERMLLAIFFILPPKKGAWRRICAARVACFRGREAVNLSQRRQGAAGSSRCGSKKPSASLRSIPAWITPSAILASGVSSGSRVNSYNVVHPLGEKSDAQILCRLEYQSEKGFYLLQRAVQSLAAEKLAEHHG